MDTKVEIDQLAIGNRKLAMVFPGQGSQSPGMGKELFENFPVAREVFEEADDALGFSISRLCFDGPEEDLQLTENTQPAILTVSIAAFRALKDAGIEAGAFVAGHSLGEYSALVAADALALSDAVRTVRARGLYMQEAVPVGTGAMAAVIGGELSEVQRICEEASRDQVCSVANINSPNQVVIAGAAEAVDRAVESLNGIAKRVIKLKVSAPFHCALMRPAQERLAKDLEQLDFNRPATPVITNVDARVTTAPDELRDALVRQVSAPVRWLETMQLLIQQGIDSFVEVGPGKVLSGLTRQTSREVKTLNVEDAESLKATQAALAAMN